MYKTMPGFKRLIDDYFNNINVMLVTQSCPTLCHLMDRSPPDSSVHGILQARILEWVVMSSSRGSCQPKDRTCISCVSCTANL